MEAVTARGELSMCFEEACWEKEERKDSVEEKSPGNNSEDGGSDRISGEQMP